MNPRNPIAILSVVIVGLASYGCGSGSDGTAGGSTPIPQPTAAQFKAAGEGNLPLAPQSQRVDLSTPPFSDPTNITNPLFPISNLDSVVLNGHIDGKPFHTETTLLPYTRTFSWGGQQVETLVSQYVAFVDGRIDQVALDYYAQADDGAVWYFGEEAYNYNDKLGVIAFTSETWLAGKDGPPAMIMPGPIQVGDVFRTENMPGLTFEEVTVRTLDKTVPGPTGQIHRAMVAKELHDEGSFSPKVFAPGYGEFYTHEGRELEAVAVAVPTDALNTPPPADLEALASGANRALGAIESGNWSAASSTASSIGSAWKRFQQSNQVPPRLAPPMDDAIKALSAAVAARDPERAGTAAIDVGQAALDIELRFLPPDQIDLGRFELFARQIVVDAQAGNLGGVSGDVAAMELDRDRFRASVPAADLSRLDSLMTGLRDAVDSKDLKAASVEAKRILSTSSQLTLTD